ncbi:MAG: 3-hydroxyacyl-CoA dehydrogenase NAD-binding domain-containing protein [Proteobacteria bacterium]|nr:3-hydroxyacyl-CoA dehydrogenase NAD-binding domain-containing protein [Pseudomonadota bacterium]
MNNRAPIQSVLIVGYGVMGKGVSATFAAAGFDTMIKSSRAAELDDLPPGVTATADFPAEAPDLVIEFVPEDVAIKQQVFAGVEAAWPDDDVIIATGTSGMSLDILSETLAKPELFTGVHYFMPADTTAVAEVMAGPGAPAEVVDAVADAVRRTGKEIVTLYKPIVGFLINRLQHIILHEAYYLVEEGVATPEDIDMAARKMLAPRMCLNGLIEQKDTSGLEIHALAQSSIVPELHPIDTPNPLIQDMVARGEVGLSAGKGFYDWEGCDVDLVRKQSSERLRKLSKFLDDEVSEYAPGTKPKTRELKRGR